MLVDLAWMRYFNYREFGSAELRGDGLDVLPIFLPVVDDTFPVVDSVLNR